MNKKKILLLLLIVVFLNAMPTSDTNIAKNRVEIGKIEETNIDNIQTLFDGVVSSREEFSTVVKGNENRHIVMRLSHPFYIRKVVVSVDKGEACDNLIVRYSKNTTFWNDFDDIEKNVTDKSVEFIINGSNYLANYLSFVFIPKNGQNFRIQEIEIYPQMDVRLRSRWIKDNWTITDREAFNNIDTKIDTITYLKFSKYGAINKFNSSASPVLEGETMVLENLEPGTPYEYKTSVTDYNGNILEIEPRELRTKALSLAYNKPFEGTFSKHYDGSVVDASEKIITNGSTDINKGLALSGSLRNDDQYAIIDLEKETSFSEVVTIWRGLGYSKDFEIQISKDKQNWQTIAEHQNAETGLSSRASGHPVQVATSKFERTTARYIKILAKKDSSHYNKHGAGELQLFEVKVFL